MDNNIFMMLFSNFTLAFFMLWPHMQWWRKHEKSNGQIGQLHPEDVVIHDVLQRPKPYFAREYPKPHLFLYAILIYSYTLLVPSHRWHPKRRIEGLYADAGRSSELVLKKCHGCLNIFCFFLTVLCMILLYCHWVYLKSTVIVN